MNKIRIQKHIPNMDASEGWPVQPVHAGSGALDARAWRSSSNPWCGIAAVHSYGGGSTGEEEDRWAVAKTWRLGDLAIEGGAREDPSLFASVVELGNWQTEM
jgi:hypothetical protein